MVECNAHHTQKHKDLYSNAVKPIHTLEEEKKAPVLVRVKGLKAIKNDNRRTKREKRGTEKKGENSFLVFFNRFTFVYMPASVCV